MKITNNLLNDILEQTTHDFETMGVYVRTEFCKEDGFCIDYRYNELDNDLDGLTFFMGDNPVNLTDEQLDIIFLYAVDLHNQELDSEEYFKRMSSDSDNGSHLFI